MDPSTKGTTLASHRTRCLRRHHRQMFGHQLCSFLFDHCVVQTNMLNERYEDRPLQQPCTHSVQRVDKWYVSVRWDLVEQVQLWQEQQGDVCHCSMVQLNSELYHHGIGFM